MAIDKVTGKRKKLVKTKDDIKEERKRKLYQSLTELMKKS